MFRKSALIVAAMILVAAASSAQAGGFSFGFGYQSRGQQYCRPPVRVFNTRALAGRPVYYQGYASYHYQPRVFDTRILAGAPAYPNYSAPAYAPAPVRQEVNSYSHTEVNINGNNNKVAIGGAGAPVGGPSMYGYTIGQYVGHNHKGKLKYDIDLPNGWEAEVRGGYVVEFDD